MSEAVCIFLCIMVLLVIIFFIYKKQQENSQNFLLLETNAIFKKNKADGITCLLSGIFLIGLFVFINYKDSEATMRNMLVGIVLGTFFCLVGIVFLLLNFKAYFYIDNGHIKGKYHWFGKIDCYIS